MRNYSDKGVKMCKTITGLASIKKSDIELVVWQRSLPPQFQDWIDQTDANNLPELRILVKPDKLQLALEPLLDKCGLKIYRYIHSICFHSIVYITLAFLYED